MLFDEAFTPIVAYAWRRAPTPIDADDVVAEVFTVAWRRLDEVPLERPLPWLYGVARRVLANQYRSADRRNRLARRLAMQPHNRGESAEDQDDVLDAVGRLRPADREILRLAAWEQLGPADIAVVLGCTVNAATLRLSRARARLRSELTGAGGSRTHAGRRRGLDV